MLNCFCLFTQFRGEPIIFPTGATYLKDLLNDQERVFLQHGVIKDDMSRNLDITKCGFTKFVTSTRPEYESILRYGYGYDDDVPILTGLPRFDRLYDDPKNIITIIPTWRSELFTMHDEDSGIWMLGDNFRESSFCRFYSDVMGDGKFIDELESKGYRLQFVPHPTHSERGRSRALFDIDDRVEVLEDLVDYNRVYAESKVMITDFSSAIFDFAYLRKPVLYAHFDIEERGLNYEKGDFFSYEKDGFGEIARTPRELKDKILTLIDSDCKMDDEYLVRVDRLFEYHDRDCCKRIYDILTERKAD